MSGSVTTISDNEIQKQTYQFNDWTIESHKSHILESKCSQKEICDNETNPKNRCLFCQ